MFGLTSFKKQFTRGVEIGLVWHQKTLILYKNANMVWCVEHLDQMQCYSKCLSFFVHFNLRRQELLIEMQYTADFVFCFINSE